MVEGLSGEVYDLVTYLIMTCDDKTSVSAAEGMTIRKCLQAAISFIYKVRGVNVIMITFKIAKFCCGKYCTGFRSTLYAHPGTRVLGAEKKLFLEGVLVADYSLEFRIIHNIPVFFLSLPASPL